MENGQAIIHITYGLVQEIAFLATIRTTNKHFAVLHQSGFSLVPLLEVTTTTCGSNLSRRG